MAEYAPPALQNFRPTYAPGTVDATLTGPLEIMHRKQQEGLAEQHAQERERQGREGLGLQSRQVATSERRADRYADMTNRQENRREAQAQFERQKLADAQHESLLHDLYAATTANDPRAIQYAIDALHRAGYQTEQMEHVADPQVSPASVGSGFNGYDPTLGGTLLGDNESAEPRPDNERAEGEKPPLPGQNPMAKKKADAKLSSELDAAEQKYIGGLQGPMSYEQAMAQANRSGARGVKQVSGGWAPITPAEDTEADRSNAAAGRNAQTSRELDAIEQRYMGGLQPARKRFLPGQDIILGAGDSFNRLK